MPILTLEEVGKVGSKDISCEIPIMMEPLRGLRDVSCDIPIMMEPLRGSRERG